MPDLTMASLFDGIGGFPLAAVRCGIRPVWASEIESFPIEVTKIRFPEMRHMGDITKLDGAALPPVEVVTGGSPCQDLSVASTNRAGLRGARSGLFMEQVRIVREMREADERRGRAGISVRPRYMVWENVPGCFHSGTPKTEDFKIVLEEICRVKDSGHSIPRPPGGAWEPAGAVLGEEFSLAWRVLDAQYWPGTPQRRRRIYLVADFAGHSAPQILFEQERLFGDPAPGEGTGQGSATRAGGGAEDTGGACMTTAFACNQRDEVRDLHDVAGAVCATQAIKQQTLLAETGCLTPWDTQQQRVFTEGSVAPTLAGADGGGGRNPGGLVFAAGFSGDAGRAAHSIGYQEECAPTLRAGNKNSAVLCLNDQGGQRMDLSCGVTGTLRAQMESHPPLVFENHGIDARCTGPLSVAPTMSARYGTGGNNIPLAMEESYCISGNVTPQGALSCHDAAIHLVDRQTHNGGNHMGIQPDIAYTITTTDKHAVYSRQRVDVFAENDVASTQSARQYKDATDLVCRAAPSPIHLVRRLTPFECEKLQGYDGYWTEIPGCSDSARYKALGNSVAIPCVSYVMRGIAHFLRLQYAPEEVIPSLSTPST